jgi:hypothetical protein
MSIVASLFLLLLKVLSHASVSFKDVGMIKFIFPRLVPVPILGFEQLQSRMKFQQQETALHQNALEVEWSPSFLIRSECVILKLDTLETLKRAKGSMGEKCMK